MQWSHNSLWMATTDDRGVVKYWQSNMNNVHTFQAHNEPIRGCRWEPLIAAPGMLSSSVPIRVHMHVCVVLQYKYTLVHEVKSESTCVFCILRVCVYVSEWRIVSTIKGLSAGDHGYDTRQSPWEQWLKAEGYARGSGTQGTGTR